MSDLPVEADRDHWIDTDLRPFIEATIEAFGPGRVMYGGDWPVCLQATSLQRWVDLLDSSLAALSDQELRMIYCENAKRFYRLQQ